MQGTLRIACLALALAAVAGCAGMFSAGSTGLNEPSSQEMRQALLALMDEQPDIFIPEFKESLLHDAPVTVKGFVWMRGACGGPCRCGSRRRRTTISGNSGGRMKSMRGEKAFFLTNIRPSAR